MSSFWTRLLLPRLPPCAIGLEKDGASVVQLERAPGGFAIRRAAAVALPNDVLKPSFDQTNIIDPAKVAGALTDLLTSAGLLSRRKWSVALPEISTRAGILTVEGAIGSRRELEEVLEWKVERAFGAPVTELCVAREPLPPDGRKQTRYLATAVRLPVLAEYESVFAALGWQVGLILPRHIGEEQWLCNGRQGDGLLLSAHDEGFMAVLLRNNRPFIMRSVLCESSDRDDELHRVLLFYRERSAPDRGSAPSPTIDRLLVLGERFDKNRVAEIARETLGVSLRPLDASSAGLAIPGRDISFDTIAAPAGMARLAF